MSDKPIPAASYLAWQGYQTENNPGTLKPGHHAVSPLQAMWTTLHDKREGRPSGAPPFRSQSEASLLRPLTTLALGLGVVAVDAHIVGAGEGYAVDGARHFQGQDRATRRGRVDPHVALADVDH